MFLLALALLAPILFFAAMILGGPHSDALPSALQPLGLLALWGVLIVLPAWLALRAHAWHIRRAVIASAENGGAK